MSEKDAPLPLQADGQPDWDRVPFDPLCPRCDYNLRMLTVQRCPECGFEFEWARVFDLTRQRHEFLFEHNWNRKPVRSLLVTFWRALRPWSFWRGVSIYDEVRVGPLLFVLALGIVLGPVASLVVAYSVATLLSLLGTSQLYSNTAAILTNLVDLLVWDPQAGGTLLVSWGSGQLLAALMLCTLQQTLARCRVRTAQVIRVAAYAALGGGTTLGVVFALWTVVVVIRAVTPALALSAAAALAIVVPAFFVGVGLHGYLRLPRPGVVAVTFSFVGALAVFTVYMVIVMWGHY